MLYIIYEITNNLNNKKLIAKFSGIKPNFKISSSSNKNLLLDIKKYGRNNFTKKIVYEFNNKNDLNNKFKLLKKKYQKTNNSYNCAYILSEAGKLNILLNNKIRIRKRLSNKYPNFKKDIKKHTNHSYILKNYCEHGDIIISINKFSKKYSIDNFLYCEQCINNYIKTLQLSSLDIKKWQVKIEKISVHPKQCESSFLKFYYPILYKSILLWSEQYNDITFNERLYLFKNKLNKKPICLCCQNTVNFSPTKKYYNTYCNQHINSHHTSSKEIELLNFIKIYYNKVISNFKLPNNLEIDIYIPELKIGFEFNGLYWHSDVFKTKEYHYNKWMKCNENGIQLITIWEDDWENKKNLVKSIISNKIYVNKNKIYARKTKIKEVTYIESKIFLDNNHIQGNCSSKNRLGLYYEDQLVSLMTFGKKRKILGSIHIDNDFELLRFCNKQNTSVVGGASKLFKHFLNIYNPHTIISYANLDISNGKLYKILGFNNKGHTGLNYWWVKDKRFHRSNFMKYKLVKDGADPNKTENEIMNERGYNKIYGNGNLLFVWERKGVFSFFEDI